LTLNTRLDNDELELEPDEPGEDSDTCTFCNATLWPESVALRKDSRATGPVNEEGEGETLAQPGEGVTDGRAFS